MKVLSYGTGHCRGKRSIIRRKERMSGRRSLQREKECRDGEIRAKKKGRRKLRKRDEEKRVGREKLEKGRDKTADFLSLDR